MCGLTWAKHKHNSKRRAFRFLVCSVDCLLTLSRPIHLILFSLCLFLTFFPAHNLPRSLPFSLPLACLNRSTLISLSVDCMSNTSRSSEKMFETFRLFFLITWNVFCLYADDRFGCGAALYSTMCFCFVPVILSDSFHSTRLRHTIWWERTIRARIRWMCVNFIDMGCVFLGQRGRRRNKHRL